MPELDRFERKFNPGWRVGFNWARQSVATPAEISDKCVSTLAKTLREKNGVPGFREIEEIIGNMVWGSTLRSHGANEEAVALIDTFNKLDRIVRDKNGHIHTKIAVDSAKSIIIQYGNSDGGQVFWPSNGQFGEKVCTDLVEHYYFANARLYLVTEGKFENPEQAELWANDVRDSMQPNLAKIANQLLTDPGAKGMRAPNRTVKRKSTSDLLEENLTST